MLTALRERRAPLALSFVSGFVDALFFIELGGLFVGLVTGNVVLLGLGLVGHAEGGLRGLQIMTFPLFMAGAGLSAVIAARVEPLHRATFWILHLAAAGFAAAALLAVLNIGAAASALITVTVMGMLTGINRLDSGLGPPFSLMTGNIAGLAVAGARRLIGYAETPKEWAQSLTSILLVLGFVAGCALGALAQTTIGVGAMALPAAIILLIAWLFKPADVARA